MTRVRHLYHQGTPTFTYVESDASSGLAAIGDPVLNFHCASGTLGTRSADEVVKYITDQSLSLRCVCSAYRARFDARVMTDEA